MMKGRRRRSIRLPLAVAADGEGGQTTTEYAVVLAALLLALGAVIFVLEPPIQSFIEAVGGKLATILS